jgi:hypothetical protein
VARALRRPGLVLAALIAVSTVAYAIAGTRIHGLWIMPDEAIYADRAERLWRHGSLILGYGVLYPFVAGLPLVVGGLATLKVVQALVMSLAAVPVFLYGRRMMPPAHALIAAALTLACPLLLYSGFVMTEVLFYPVAALTLLAIARAVETATVRDQAIAIGLIVVATATRPQAAVFVGVLALAALFARRARAFWPTWLLLVVGVIVALAAPGVFGSYSGVLRGGYPVGSSLRLTYDHIAYLILATGVVPFAAFVLLLIDVARGRERDPAARSLVVVTLCAIVLVCAQVGLFSARFAPHLLGRDLAALPPLLFLVFALFLSRGRRRGWRTPVVVSFVVLAVLALTPWNDLIGGGSVPNSFGTGLVYRVSSSVDAASLITLTALVLLALLVLLPFRLRLVLPLVVLGLLIATSVATSGLVAPLARHDEGYLLGSPRNWVDRSVKADVTYLYDGEPEWNSVWMQRFWNARIEHVLSLPPARVPGPMPQTRRAPSPDGRIAVTDRYLVAADRFAFDGTPVAHHLRGRDLEPLTLWRLDSPARLSMITTGFEPNGDIVAPGHGTIVVYGCAGGRLNLTLLPKATNVVTVRLDGRLVLRRRIGGLDSWQGYVPVPRAHRDVCRFTVHGGALLGSTVRIFERSSG